MESNEERYAALNPNWFRRCGRSGLMLPTLSLGCWHNFGGAGTASNRLADEAEFHDNCRRMLFTAFDHGITHFDLANNYGPPPGAAEERVGRILKELPRDELIVSTKAGWRMWPGPYGDWGSRKYLLASLDQSLKRLNLPYVDIFYSHRQDSNTPLEETLGALDQAVRSGKAIYAGISSYDANTTREAMRICQRDSLARPIIHQPSYSMLNRKIEQGLLNATQESGLGVIAYCPLQQGLLTGKYLARIPPDSRAGLDNAPLRGRITEEVLNKLRRLNEIAAARNQSLAQMALAWVLRTGRVTSALIGASRPEQIVENVKMIERTAFSEDELALIERALA